jgi:hypothetical protein
MIRKREVIRTLKKVFSQDEVVSMATLLARATTDKREKEEQKKTVDSQLKAEIDSFNATANVLSSKISVGYEMTDVKCQIIDDLATLVRTVIRLDSGEIIDVGKVPESERQLDLADDPAGTPPAPASGTPAPAGEIRELQAPPLGIEFKGDGAPPAGPQE